MNNTESIKLTKSEYTLMDFAAFKLCPMMYRLSVLHTDASYPSAEQIRLATEAEILSESLSELVSAICESGRMYYKRTSLFLTDLVSIITAHINRRVSRDASLTAKDIAVITNGLYDKAESIRDDIHRWVKGTSYTIIGGFHKSYAMNGFNFVHSASYRSADCDNGGWRSIYCDEYKLFPVISAGKKHGHLIHYSDIIAALDEDNPDTDRVALATKIIRKINIQLESGFYTDDGLARISSLGKEIADYDFTNTECKRSGFCRYCRYYDKYCQNL